MSKLSLDFVLLKGQLNFLFERADFKSLIMSSAIFFTLLIGLIIPTVAPENVHQRLTNALNLLNDDCNEQVRRRECLNDIRFISFDERESYCESDNRKKNIKACFTRAECPASEVTQFHEKLCDMEQLEDIKENMAKLSKDCRRSLVKCKNEISGLKAHFQREDFCSVFKR